MGCARRARTSIRDPSLATLQPLPHAHQPITLTHPRLHFCIELGRVRNAKLVHPPTRHDLLDLAESSGTNRLWQRKVANHPGFVESRDPGKSDMPKKSDAGLRRRDVILTARADHFFKPIVESPGHPAPFGPSSRPASQGRTSARGSVSRTSRRTSGTSTAVILIEVMMI